MSSVFSHDGLDNGCVISECFTPSSVYTLQAVIWIPWSSPDQFLYFSIAKFCLFYYKEVMVAIWILAAASCPQLHHLLPHPCLCLAWEIGFLTGTFPSCLLWWASCDELANVRHYTAAPPLTRSFCISFLRYECTGEIRWTHLTSTASLHASHLSIVLGD